MKMKKVYLLIILCLVGMMVPQVVLADTTLYNSSTITITKSDDGTITIDSKKAGALAGINQNQNGNVFPTIASSTERIVFKGDFCTADLDKLKSVKVHGTTYDCCTQKIVDMSDAKFVKKNQSSHNTYLYHTEEAKENKSEGDHCIVGATKYISTKSTTWSLTKISEDQLGDGQTWKVKNVLADEANTITEYNYEAYVKLPTTLNYYEWNNSTNTFDLITNPTPEQISQAMSAPDDCTSDNLNSQFQYLAQQSNIVKVRPVDAEYQYFKSEAPFVWATATSLNQSDYNDGDAPSPLYYFASIEDAEAPTDHGQTVYAEGTAEYVFHNGSWVDPSQVSVTEEYDYSQMSFEYWGSNVTTAITSTHADVISSEFCKGCVNLTTLTLNSGAFSGTGLDNGVNNNNLTTVNVNAEVTSLGDGMFNGMSHITTVNFQKGVNNLAIGEDCFNSCENITSLILPARLSSLGIQAFANTKGVETLSIPENSRLTTIPLRAFKSCGNNTQAEFDITIPRSVTEIQEQGFGDMWRLKTVRFTGQQGDDPLLIETGAFAGGTESNYILSDVYVDINPQVRKLICEYGAFSYTSMEGQTAESNIEALTTLHFTEDYWDYYAGDWKKGITFDQNALNSFKDGCNTSTGVPVGDGSMIGTNEQIRASNGHIEGKSPANGWQQFAKTSTGIMILPEGKFYRTYSTPTPMIKPSWMKIYRVNGFSDGYVEGQSDATSSEQANAAKKEASTAELDFSVTVAGKTYYCIPANTGVIRVDRRDKEAIFYTLDWADTPAADEYDEAWEYPYSVKPGDESEDESVGESEGGSEGESVEERVNYLVPTLDGEITIGPVVKEGNTIKYRIFGLKRLTVSGEIPPFLRSKRDVVMGDHRAFLKLPAKVFHWTNEKNGSSQDATGNDVVVDDDNTYAKISLFFGDDFEDVNGGNATEIINAIEEDMYKNDSFYTIQGVKVAKPTTKGVYIHNGKKIYIK